MNGLTVSSKKHIRELDGVRGLAVLMVLIWHYVNCQGAAQLGTALEYFTNGTRLFWSGVDLFFVLSGFLIGGILIDNSEKPGFYRTFYIRRAARILPVYGLLLLLFFIYRASLDPGRFSWLFSDDIPDFAYVSFTQNIFMGVHETFGGRFLGITWSLAVEEQFYLLLPLSLFLFGSSRLLAVTICLALLAPFLRLAFPGFSAVVNMPFRMDSLLIGVVLAFAFRSVAFVSFVDRNRQLVWTCFFILLFGMGLMTMQNIGRKFCEPFVIAAFYAVLISLILLNRGSFVTAVFRTGFLVRLGMYSYGLYMYHQMVAGIIHGYFRGTAPSMATSYGVLLTFASLLITCVLAVASYHTYEAFFLSLGRQFKYDGGAVQEGATATQTIETKAVSHHPVG